MAPFVFSVGRKSLLFLSTRAVVIRQQQTLKCAPLSAARRCVALSPGKTTGFFISDVRKLTPLGYNYSAFRKS